jgi:hypothetical protein
MAVPLRADEAAGPAHRPDGGPRSIVPKVRHAVALAVHVDSCLRDEESNAGGSSMRDARRVNVRPDSPQGSGRSAVISDGNRDGNDGNRQRPDATINSHVLPARLA